MNILSRVLFCAILLQALVISGFGAETITLEKRMMIGRLALRVPIPPSSSSTSDRDLIIGRLPKGVPIPPSGPNRCDHNDPISFCLPPRPPQK